MGCSRTTILKCLKVVKQGGGKGTSSLVISNLLEDGLQKEVEFFA